MAETRRETGKEALKTWCEKLDFLLAKEAEESDAGRKFQLRKLIEEARAKIVELEQESMTSLRSKEYRRPLTRSRPRFAEADLRQRSEELDRLYGEKRARRIAGKDTSGVDEAIRRCKRELRRGPNLRLGDRLLNGRFELLESLGHGGFGQVWKAWDEALHDCVAVKVLFAHLLDERSKVDRFFCGAKSMAKLHHPHVVRILEPYLIDEEDGWHFFVMEWVDGYNLEQAVLKKLLSSHDEKCRIIRQIGEALEHAHEIGLVHRDVKPANILLDHHFRPKLTDFDLVRVEGTETPKTATHAMMGTIPFAAPELFSSPHEAGPPADVYGLASTAVFVFYGEPLPGHHFYNPAVTIGRLDIPEDLARVLNRAADRDLKIRYPTVKNFVDEFMDPPRPPGPRSGGGKERRITNSRKDSTGNIMALSNPYESWSPRSKSDVISDIESGTRTYYVLQWDGTRADVEVVHDGVKGKYLRTRPNQTSRNSLGTLPDG